MDSGAQISTPFPFSSMLHLAYFSQIHAEAFELRKRMAHGHSLIVSLNLINCEGSPRRNHLSNMVFSIKLKSHGKARAIGAASYYLYTTQKSFHFWSFAYVIV